MSKHCHTLVYKTSVKATGIMLGVQVDSRY